jgi:hypothetical protein
MEWLGRGVRMDAERTVKKLLVDKSRKRGEKRIRKMGDFEVNLRNDCKNLGQELWTKRNGYLSRGMQRPKLKGGTTKDKETAF